MEIAQKTEVIPATAPTYAFAVRLTRTRVADGSIVEVMERNYSAVYTHSEARRNLRRVVRYITTGA